MGYRELCQYYLMEKIYHSRDRGEGDVEKDKSSDEVSREAQGEAGVKGQAREENNKVKQLQGKWRRSSGLSSTLHSEVQQQEAASRMK
ncbi:hypothetical protein TNCT_136251 [Trichonephila clavata]|uniref:Uncharacterized protein n=1 Tax=Trichonephila clavata TaxID=2740835 RepID=A0A8X6FWT6_TRICU|nr:hypothetical protein TNCT_136251 [Trichonephila clavata]